MRFKEKYTLSETTAMNYPPPPPPQYLCGHSGQICSFPAYVRWRNPFPKLPESKTPTGPSLGRSPAHSLALWPTELTVPAPGDQPPLFLAGSFPHDLPSECPSCAVLAHCLPSLDWGLFFVRGEGKRRGCTGEWSVTFLCLPLPPPHLPTWTVDGP